MPRVAPEIPCGKAALYETLQTLLFNIFSLLVFGMEQSKAGELLIVSKAILWSFPLFCLSLLRNLSHRLFQLTYVFSRLSTYWPYHL